MKSTQLSEIITVFADEESKFQASEYKKCRNNARVSVGNSKNEISQRDRIRRHTKNVNMKRNKMGMK